MTETAQEKELNSNVVLIGSGNAGTSAAIAAILYDADAEQRLTFVVSDDDGKYEITQVFGPLEDAILEQYDRMREVSLESSGNTTDLNTDAVAADDYLFKAVCLDVLGYDGEKPENWRDEIDYEEKKAGIGKLLAFKIVSSDKEKQLKKRAWGSKSGSNTVELKSYFNGETVLTKAHFNQKTPADTAAYAVLKNRVSLVDRDLDDSAIKIPASMKRKAKLFDKMNPRVESYAGRVPLHHKAAFITGFFEPRIADTEKK